MTMPGRTTASGSYRYGFNGKENDGETGTQDYGMRIYNQRLGRFLSVDPLQQKLPALSPYNFCYNSPIQVFDPDGKLGIYVQVKQNKETGKYTVISITITDDLTSKPAQRPDIGLDWHDFMIIYDNPSGTPEPDHSKLTPLSYQMFSFRTNTWFLGEGYAKSKVDDGYFKDGGGVMFTSSDGVGSAARRTRSSVNVVNIDGLVAAMGGASRLDDLKLPDLDETYLLEAVNKFKEIYMAATNEKNKASSGGDYKSPDIQKLLGDLEAVINKDNSNRSEQTKPSVVHIDKTIYTKNGYKYPSEGKGRGGTTSESKDSSNARGDTTYRLKTIYRKSTNN